MTSAAASSRLPYPGLRSFRREESDLFFGREDCINVMVDRLAATRFLAVLGSSGTGKSSVVKTGLLDGLDLGLMATAGSSWRVVDFRPGGAPLRNLARRLLETSREGTKAGADVPDGDVELLRAFLVRGPRSVAEWCGDGHLPEQTNLLLLVDQFEELFRYRDYAGREEAEAFASLLLESARQARFPIYVVLTMRSEYLGACVLMDGLAESISAGMFLIPRMNREQCRSAILGPATLCDFDIEDTLANRLLNDLAAFAPWDDRGTGDQLNRLGRRADQLPLLQYCLNRMWVRAREGADGGRIKLTVADYERIGGLSGALNAHADEILHSLGDARRPVAEMVFRALTEGSSIAEAVRRPTRFSELVELCHGDEAGVRAVVDAFRAPGCNFLAPELDPENPKPLTDATIIDISHESLIRQWKQLSEWLEAEVRAVRQWRRWTDRFEDGELMHRNELAAVRAWLREQKPSASWTRRYGGDFQAVSQFIKTSERRSRRLAPVMLPLFSIAVFSGSFLVMAGILTIVFKTSDVHWTLGHAIGSEIIAVTAAFGLWRYAGHSPGRATLAAIVMVAVGISAAFGFMGLLMWRGLESGPSGFWWNITLAAPITVALLAAFEPTFRKLPAFVLSAASYAIPIQMYDYLFPTLSTGGAGVAFAWLLFCVVIGNELRRIGFDKAYIERRPVSEAIRYGLVGFSILYFCGYWANGVSLVLSGNGTAPVPAAIGVNSAALAFTLAYGLRQYRATPLRTAALAGLGIFVLEFAARAAVMGVLMGQGIPLVQSALWQAAVPIAPCALAWLAIFDRSFRSVSTWLLLVALCALPFAGLAWLEGRGLLTDVKVLSILATVILAVWIAAVGYRLQRAPREVEAELAPGDLALKAAAAA